MGDFCFWLSWRKIQKPSASTLTTKIGQNENILLYVKGWWKQGSTEELNSRYDRAVYR